ncbi:MAG TPA: DUF952 domain-containing protein [Acidimicrobiia bacterium]
MDSNPQRGRVPTGDAAVYGEDGPLTRPIYHLAEPGDWAARTDVYQAPSLQRDGFIHCSTADQVDAVARRLYRGRCDLTLLTIDPGALGKSLAFEGPAGSGETFPHVYGAIPTQAVLDTRPYLRHIEEDLWRPETRFDREWMDRILHQDFEEFGASGRHHSRLDTMDTPQRPFHAQLPLVGFRQASLTPDVALVNYLSRVLYENVEERARRTSVWVNTAAGWQLRFHQGTPVALA